MTEVAYASLEKPKKAGTKSSAEKPIRTKSVRMPDGSKAKFASLDADSPNLAQDLTATFRRDVARARRENIRLTGKADAIGHKS